MKAFLMEGNGVTYGRDKRFFPAIKMLLLAFFFASTSIFAYGGPPPAYTPKVPGRIRFALCQTATAKPDGTNVVNRVFDWIRRKNLDGVDVFILPELAFASFLNLESAWRLADSVWCGASAFTREKGAWLVVNQPVRTDRGVLYNETRVFAPDGEVFATYRKRILARIDLQASFSPGDAARPVELPFAKVGLLICKDAFFPNVGSGAYADADIIVTQFAHPGVDINTAREARFFPPTAWALSELRDSSAGWRRFGKPFLAVNKVGRDGPYNLVGGSHVTDANGRRGAELGSGPGVLLVDFPLKTDGHVEAKPTPQAHMNASGMTAPSVAP